MAAELADGVLQAFSFEGGGQQVVGDLPHAGDDLVYVLRGFGDHLPVPRVVHFHAADVKLYAGKQWAKGIVQVGGDALALIFKQPDLRGDAFPLEAYKPAVVADN